MRPARYRYRFGYEGQTLIYLHVYLNVGLLGKDFNSHIKIISGNLEDDSGGQSGTDIEVKL